jgi:hypothetical protein
VREDGTGLVLADLASRNGTRVAGGTPAAETSLQPGERFILGRTLLRVTKV